jgi:hypothetical protein
MRFVGVLDRSFIGNRVSGSAKPLAAEAARLIEIEALKKTISNHAEA